MSTKPRGNALIITLILLTVAAVLVGTVLDQTMTTARNTNRSRNMASAQAAAEGAVEYGYAAWLNAINSKGGKLTKNDLAALNLGSNAPALTGSSPVSFGTNPALKYDPVITGTLCDGTVVSGTLTILALDAYGAPVTSGNQAPDGVIGPVVNYPGWWGKTYTYAATARVKPAGTDYSAGVRRLFQYTEVSMFQTMYFFNDDLEIFNPATMTLSGLVHSNGAVYLSSASGNPITILGNVSTSGSATLPPGVTGSNIEANYYYSSVPGFSSYESPYVLQVQPTGYVGSPYYESLTPTWSSGTGTGGGSAPPQLDQVPVLEPFGVNMADLFATSGTSTPNLSGTYHEIIDAPNVGYADPLASSRLYNNAGLIILVSGTGRTGGTAGSPSGQPLFSASDIAITSATAAVVNGTATGDYGLAPVASQGFIYGLSGTSGHYTVLVSALNNASIVPDTPGGTTYNNALKDLANSLSEQVSSGTNALYDYRQTGLTTGSSSSGYMNTVNVLISNSVSAITSSTTITTSTTTSHGKSVITSSTTITTSTTTTMSGGLNNFIYNDLVGSFNGVVYVQNAGTAQSISGTTIPTVSGSNNAVRLQNGQVLPSSAGATANTLNVTDGLTVVSSNPVYIQGDYNTGYGPQSSTNPSGSTGTNSAMSTGTYGTASILLGGTASASTAYTRLPAAVIGDAVTFLSNNWSDPSSDNFSGSTYSLQTAASTTYNAAILGGYMQATSSTWTGGAQNYARYLENWSSKNCTYWGSMVEIYQSTQASKPWRNPGIYYNPPNRYFNFDTNYLTTTPPGSVATVVKSKGPWSKY